MAIGYFKSLAFLSWKPSPQQHPLPEYISRSFVSTPPGQIELLVCEPLHRSPSCPPIIFAHGGCGSASVWLEWMEYFHANYGGTTYAYSARNHGASFPVPYSKMVFGTSLDDIASDWVAVIKHVTSHLELGVEPVLVAHSAGGALAQYVLSKGIVTTRGLGLVGAIPHFGGYDAYWNWAKIDPWLFVRSIFCAGHPMSPLSQLGLVHRAFFGPKLLQTPEYGWPRVKEFMRWLPSYESMGWATGVNGSFWSWMRGRNVWLDVGDILSSVTGWDNPGDRVCIMVGSHDLLMDMKMATRQAQEYREGMRAMGRETKTGPSLTKQPSNDNAIEGVSIDQRDMVRLVVVKDAGHHTQNDVQCKAAAEACLRWVKQL